MKSKIFDAPILSPTIIGNSSVTIDVTLSNNKKDSTSTICYKKLLLEKIYFYQPEMVLTWFAVVRQLTFDNFIAVGNSRLPNHIRIFTAELYAVKTAISYANDTNKRTLIICTDNLGVAKALFKNCKEMFNNIIFI